MSWAMARLPVWLTVALLGIASCAAFTSVTFKVPWLAGAARWQIHHHAAQKDDVEQDKHEGCLVESPPLEVLELDDNLLVLNKPWDVRIDGDHEVTVMKMAMKLFPEEDPPMLRFCHRLDFATSGVLCMALTKEANAAANRLFENRKAAKQYLAVCYGHIELDDMRIESPIAGYQVAEGETPINPTGCPEKLQKDFRMCVGSEDNPGRAALTELHVLARGVYQGNNVTKVSLAPSTGRRHQLRVHLNSIGHPIVGDFTYCGDAESPRMMLHAHSLSLPLPAKFGGVREWVAPDPFLDILEPA